MAALVAVGLYVDLGAGKVRPPGSAIDQIDCWLVKAGLGLEHVSLSGHRHTTDNDVFAAMGWREPISMLRFDTAAAATAIRNLPWIADVEIVRHVPGSLEIRIREREPFAVWQSDGRSHLIDRTGHILAQAGSQPPAGLPVVTGAGAQSEAGRFIDLLRTQPDIAAKAERGIRISERRWTIQLKDGSKLHLPAVGEADALAAIARLDMQSGLLGLGYGEIDARGPQLVLIGRNEGPRSKPATPQSISALIEADRRRSW